VTARRVAETDCGGVRVAWLGNGVVQRAVVGVLAAASGPMRGADVHQAVERLLGRPVPKNSVSWSLAADARSKEPRFARTMKSHYQLRR
jgi:hypothetical protein